MHRKRSVMFSQRLLLVLCSFGPCVPFTSLSCYSLVYLTIVIQMSQSKGSTKKKTNKKLDDLSPELVECLEILNALCTKDDAEAFKVPVDWEGLGLPDYPQLITRPMDLGTIQTKLEGGEYDDHEAFAADVRLVWSNAKTYNQPGSGIYLAADRLSKIFEKKFSKFDRAVKLEPKVEAEHTLREATQEDKAKFIKQINHLNHDQLGAVLKFLDTRCAECISEETPEDMNIEIAKIDSVTILALNDYADQCTNQQKKRKV